MVQANTAFSWLAFYSLEAPKALATLCVGVKGRSTELWSDIEAIEWAWPPLKLKFVNLFTGAWFPRSYLGAFSQCSPVTAAFFPQ